MLALAEKYRLRLLTWGTRLRIHIPPYPPLSHELLRNHT